MSEHPKMLYRDGAMVAVQFGDNPADQLWLDYRIVADAAEEAEALAQGWRISPIADPHDLPPVAPRPKRSKTR